MLNGIDVIVIVIIGGITVIQVKRGVGPALLDTVGLVASAKFSSFWYEGFARLIHCGAVFSFCLLFGLMGLVSIFISRYIYGMTLWTLEPYDAFLGGLLGVVCGWAVAYVVLKIMLVGYGEDSGIAEAIRNSAFGLEIIEFTTYHKIASWLSAVGTPE